MLAAGYALEVNRCMEKREAGKERKDERGNTEGSDNATVDS